ncbi:MAG: PP2C family protein-serine/threonine phosphatase [Candidatus Thorarchaeota archaeon]
MAKQLFNYGNHSDDGMVHDHNEDSLVFFTAPLGACFVICDGVGGNAGGEIASQLACDIIKETLQASTRMMDPTDAIRQALERANNVIRAKRVEVPALNDTATTCVLLLLDSADDSKGWVAHVGDSRAYVLRRNIIRKLTRDHSRVMKMVAHGLITEEEARDHPQSNIIERSLGSDEILQPDIKEITVYKNDRYILCSDGVSDMMRDEEILASSESSSIEDLPKILIDIANKRGGPDNSTAFSVEILRGAKSPKPPKPKKQPEAKGSSSSSSIKTILLSFFSGVIATLLVMALLPYLNHEDPLVTQEVDLEDPQGEIDEDPTISPVDTHITDLDEVNEDNLGTDFLWTQLVDSLPEVEGIELPPGAVIEVFSGEDTSQFTVSVTFNTEDPPSLDELYDHFAGWVDFGLEIESEGQENDSSFSVSFVSITDIGSIVCTGSLSEDGSVTVSITNKPSPVVEASQGIPLPEGWPEGFTLPVDWESSITDEDSLIIALIYAEENASLAVRGLHEHFSEWAEQNGWIVEPPLVSDESFTCQITSSTNSTNDTLNYEGSIDSLGTGAAITITWNPADTGESVSDQ